MTRGRAVLVALLLALVFTGPVGAASNCDAWMNTIAEKTIDSYDLIDWINGFENHIGGPHYNPTTDAWMHDALGWAIDDLTGVLNEIAVLNDALRAAQCY